MDTSLAAVVRGAEEYLRLQGLLEASLQQGFVGLSGAKLGLRPNNILLNAETWPEQNEAAIRVNASLQDELEPLKERELRQWISGSMVTPDILETQRHFIQVVRLALQLQKVRSRLQLLID
jgi:hypothetical protein